MPLLTATTVRPYRGETLGTELFAESVVFLKGVDDKGGRGRVRCGGVGACATLRS